MMPKCTPSLLLVAAFCAGTGAAQAQQKLVPTQSEIVFVARQMGVPIEGRFKKFDANIAFDPARPETGKIAFTVDLASASLGAPEFDAELPKSTWFHTTQFPQATFQSSAIRSLGGGKFEISGKLAIKGQTRDTVIPVNLVPSGAYTSASGSFTIQRLAFKVGENEWADTSLVANDVQLKFKLMLSGLGKF